MNIEGHPRNFINRTCKTIFYERCRYFTNLYNTSWRFVAKLQMFTDEKPICPICWETPFIPRINSCGHYFCFSCISRLIHLTSFDSFPSSIPCPVCRTSILTYDSMKRVIFHTQKYPQINDEITLNLLVKNAGNEIPRLADKLSHIGKDSIPDNQTELNFFSDFLIQNDSVSLQDITNDFRLLRKSSLINNRKQHKALCTILKQERKSFNSVIRMNERDEEVQKLSATICEENEQFNILFYNSHLSLLFYKAPNLPHVYMEPSQAKSLTQLQTEVPVKITGKITNIRRLTTSEQTKRDGILPFLPCNIEIVLTTLNVLEKKLPNDLQNIKSLKRHAELLRHIDEKRTREHEEMIKRRKQNENKSLTKQTNEIHHRSAYHFEQTFNTCIFGIECVDPDDDFPHDPTCPIYKKDDGASLF